MLRRVVSKQSAFLRKNWASESSYKMALLLELGGSTVPLFAFYFISKLVEARDDDALGAYGAKYFDFVLVGLGLTQYFSRALRTFTENIRRAQTSGVMEAFLSSRTSPASVVLYDSTYSFFIASSHLAVTFGVGIYALGVDVIHANWMSVFVVFGLSLATFLGLGILSAALLVAFKKGDPISYVFGLGSSIVSGALFPTELLPEWLKWLSYGLPMTHTLEALRLALFRGYELGQLAFPLVSLGAMALSLLPISLWLFTRMVERGRCDGSLAHY